MHIPDEEVAEFATEVVPSLPAALPVLIDDDAMVKPEILGPFPLLRVDLSDQGRVCSGAPPMTSTAGSNRSTVQRPPLAYRDRAAETAALAGVRDAMQTVAAVCTRWRNQAIHYMQQDLRRTGSKSLVDAITVLSNAPTVPTPRAEPTSTCCVAPTPTRRSMLPCCARGPCCCARTVSASRSTVTATASVRRRANPTSPLTADGVGGNDWFNLHLRVEVDGLSCRWTGSSSN